MTGSFAAPGITQLAGKMLMPTDEVNHELVGALEAALVRKAQDTHGVGIIQVLVRCLISVRRSRTVPQESGGAIATCLALDAGSLFPAVLHEATCFLAESNVTPAEVLRVVAPLASEVLLRPECEDTMRCWSSQSNRRMAASAA